MLRNIPGLFAVSLCALLVCSGAARAADAGESHRSVTPREGEKPMAMPVPKPSFDCTTARSKVKLIICSDVDLANLDVQEEALLRRARARAVNADAVNADHDVWLGDLATCTTAPCIARAYRRRIQELRQWTN